MTLTMLGSGLIMVRAENTASPQPPGPQRIGASDRPQNRGMRRMQPLLTQEEKDKLQAAREKAKSDPDVVAARDDLKAAATDMRDTERAAILKNDPSLQEIFDKIDKAKQGNPPPPDKGGNPPDASQGDKPDAAEGSNPPPKDGPPPPPPGAERGAMMPRLDMLTDEERAKLRDAHEKVKDNPDVKAAREKLQEAQKNLRDAVEKAMIKADPSVEPILKKLEKAREKMQRPGRRMGQPEGMPPGPPPPPEGEAPAPETSGT
jgi:Spy/CpxP family protein refolding chaperone